MSQLLSKTSLVLVALALCNAPTAAMAGTCGVLPFSAGEGVNRGAGPNITALVSSELDIRGGYDLVIAAPPEDFEGGDCGASTTCIKAFSRANKHDAVVAGAVVADGDQYTLTLKLHDGNNAALLRKVTKNVPSSALLLADAVTDIVIELVTGAAPDRDGDASADDGPLFDDVDFDELLDEAEDEIKQPKRKKRSRAAPRNPGHDDEIDLDDGDEDDDPFGIDELDALDMSADQIEKKKRDRQRHAELDRVRKEEEERLSRARAEEERQRRIAEDREREDRERARREREDRERRARIEAEQREEQERQARVRQEREREERERIQEEREEREREERDSKARAEREERDQRDRERKDRESRVRDEDERQARADRDQRNQEDRKRRDREDRDREDRERRDREDRQADDDGDEMVLGSALALGPASGIIIGGDDDDDDDDDGGIVIGAVDDEDDEPREGMIIGDDDRRENPNVRRRREADANRNDDGRGDRYSRARSFDASSDNRNPRDNNRSSSSSRDYDEDADLDLLDDDDDDRRSGDQSYDRDDNDRNYDERSYRERSYGNDPVASRDGGYLSDDYDSKDGGSRSYTAGRKQGAEGNLSRSNTGWGNRPWISARLSGGYTNYYLHFAQYGLDIGFFPVPRVSVDLQADFWTLSIRDCPGCEQQYRTLPSFYMGGSYRFTNLKIVQPYVGGDIGAVVYAIGLLTEEDGSTKRRPLTGVVFQVKGGADFMFTRHFGLGAGVKAGLAYASKIQENVHPEWNPLQFLLNVRLAAVVQF